MINHQCLYAKLFSFPSANFDPTLLRSLSPECRGTAWTTSGFINRCVRMGSIQSSCLQLNKNPQRGPGIGPLSPEQIHFLRCLLVKVTGTICSVKAVSCSRGRGAVQPLDHLSVSPSPFFFPLTSHSFPAWCGCLRFNVLVYISTPSSAGKLPAVGSEPRRQRLASDQPSSVPCAPPPSPKGMTEDCCTPPMTRVLP